MGRAPPFILGPFFVKYSVVRGHFSKIIARVIETHGGVRFPEHRRCEKEIEIAAYFCAMVENVIPFNDVFFDFRQKPFEGNADEMRDGDSELHGGHAQEFFVFAVEAEEVAVVVFGGLVFGFNAVAMDFQSF